MSREVAPETTGAPTSAIVARTSSRDHERAGIERALPRSRDPAHRPPASDGAPASVWSRRCRLPPRDARHGVSEIDLDRRHVDRLAGGVANRIAAGTRITAAARPRVPGGPRRCPGAAQLARSAAAKATANVTPYTPASTASRTVTPLDTCDTPSDPHVKPPSGHSPRSRSGSTGRRPQRRREHRMLVPPHERVPEAEERHRQRGQQRQREPPKRPEQPQPRQRDAERGQSVDEPEERAPQGSGAPEGGEQEGRCDERERPPPHRWERQGVQDATGDREEERDGEPGAGQAQSRQYIRRLSASWLRCFTR